MEPDTKLSHATVPFNVVLADPAPLFITPPPLPREGYNAVYYIPAKRGKLGKGKQK